MHLPKEYEEIVFMKGWQVNEQVQLLLKYAETFQLTEHLMAYLTAQSIAPKIDHANISSDAILSMVSANNQIQGLIVTVSLTSSRNHSPWDHESLETVLTQYFQISMSEMKQEVISDLLHYMNQKHQRLVQLKAEAEFIQEKSGKYIFGARG